MPATPAEAAGWAAADGVVPNRKAASCADAARLGAASWLDSGKVMDKVSLASHTASPVHELGRPAMHPDHGFLIEGE